MRKGKITAGG
ncbi:hok/Gef family protein, partial [Escherichia coli TW09195]